ncbi:MAG: 4Fe-4S binding protein, partial [Phycisphaerales bacterium]|nr:4Fe-4S binding protein [Phycisphaerales bacterium]
TVRDEPVDHSSVSLVRDPNKCILCGDCVRMCHEVQSVGAIDFAHRGSDVSVLPAFGKGLDDVECVHCGQCARVCPTGALTPAPQIDNVWAALEDPNTTVIAQIAPAVRVGIGECFGLEPGKVLTGQIVASLKAMGFDAVYDTCFTADLTVLEEATEFLKRYQAGDNLPQFTSCCPAWVKTTEQYYPELLNNLSTCKSPQGMFGSLAKSVLPDQLGIDKKNLFVVSIMPCTAKKFEAQRDELATDGDADVDVVITTQELGRMIEQAGLQFESLAPASLDMPFGFKTGAGILFGNTGGVTEAVLRFAYEKATGKRLENVEFHNLRGQEGIRTATIDLGDKVLTVAIAHGLANARILADQAQRGECAFDLVEVMACPGGCVNGAGQPYTPDETARHKRAQGLYDTDRTLQLHKSQDNPMLAECYETHLGEIGGHTAHELLHTSYENRRPHLDGTLELHTGQDEAKLEVAVCLGTGCHVKGSHSLIRKIIDWLKAEHLHQAVDVHATFCFEGCQEAPNVRVGDELISAATLERVQEAIQLELASIANGAPA